MRYESSWYPTVASDDSKLLAQAQAMCADLDGLYGPFERYKDFFKALMVIDWSTLAGSYITDYNHRLGLTEDRARRLVQDHGFKWNSNPGAPLEYLLDQCKEWWTDFEMMYEIDPDETPQDRRQWAEMAFYYLYQQMANPIIGSGQVHLMFNPELLHQQYSGWTSSGDIAHLGLDEHGNIIWDQWLYPGNPSIQLGEMGYFPIHFFTNLLHGTISVAGQGHLVPVGLQTLLDRIWQRWHPE